MFDLMGVCWIYLCSLTSFNVLSYLILYLESVFCAQYLLSKVCEVDNQIFLIYLVVPTQKFIDMQEYCNLSLPIISIWIQASICEKLTNTMINNLVDLPWLSIEHRRPSPQQYHNGFNVFSISSCSVLPCPDLYSSKFSFYLYEYILIGRDLPLLFH